MLGAPLLVGNRSLMTPPLVATPDPFDDASALVSRVSLRVCSVPQRLAWGGLRVLSLASLLAAAWHLFFSFTGTQHPQPLHLEVALVLLALVLWGLERLLAWWTLGGLVIEPERLMVERRGERLDIPRASVHSLHAWRWPTPGAGLSLRMRSGRLFPYGLWMTDPRPVLEALGPQELGAAELARQALPAFAHARAVGGRRSAGRWAFKFGVFPLLPAAVVFQLDQRISYGGPFAQYQLYGLGPYLRGFGLYWLYMTAALVLFASGLRALAELGALGATLLSPPHARGVRRFVEVGCALLYYAGFLALLTARILL